jgi:hypothetical protein
MWFVNRCGQQQQALPLSFSRRFRVVVKRKCVAPFSLSLYISLYLSLSFYRSKVK